MMNEQLKQLILKAGWKNAYFNPEEGFEVVFEDEDHNLACIEQFAKLIVQECIDIVADGGEFTSRPKLVEKLQEHFGVGEE
jgi:hypothetical protein